MSQFEYVMVAVALVMSLAIARLLGGLPHTLSKNRGSLVALLWNVVGILGGMTLWWILWRFSDVSWTPLRFVWIVAMPSLQYLKAAVLLTDNPGEVLSWENHYFEVRRRFFWIGVAVAIHSALLPWVLGAVPWLTPAPVHASSLLNLSISLVGLISTSRPVHIGLASLLLLQTMFFLFFVPA